MWLANLICIEHEVVLKAVMPTSKNLTHRTLVTSNSQQSGEGTSVRDFVAELIRHHSSKFSSLVAQDLSTLLLHHQLLRMLGTLLMNNK